MSAIFGPGPCCPQSDSDSSSSANSPSQNGSSASKSSSPRNLRQRRMMLNNAKDVEQRTPQAIIDDFWTKFTTKTPGKATTVIPSNPFVDRATEKNSKAAHTAYARPVLSSSSSQTTQASYEAAAAMCRAKVAKIINESRRVNMKYRDPHFDIETDLKGGRRDTLQSLSNNKRSKQPPGTELNPRSAKRVTDIFDKPSFYVDGPVAADIRQGRDGDCWLLSALCTLTNKKGLIEQLCVAHDQEVGVYGFVFHRDGEWVSEVIDDFLFLTKSDYDESILNRVLFDECERIDPDEAYRRIFQTNSGALFFAQCEHPQKTWLPLLEKCYAKAHGDYAAIEGGFGGEGLEDLTGGVTSEFFSTDILNKEKFWSELLQVNHDFLFGCSTGMWGSTPWGDRKGIIELHSYSVQRTVEIDGKRLVLLKNPWGKGEWKGPWSDGSKEWTSEWLEKLGHRFGDDGEFWIAFEDILRKYQAFDRTRLFDDRWSVTQMWNTFTIPWMLGYHSYFSMSVKKAGPVVIVLSQLDDRYFRGLEGQYTFKLAFRIHRAGCEDYIVRSQVPHRMRRSVNVELELEAGEYDVRVKIDADREDVFPIEKVIRKHAKKRREKLTRIGLAYDLAHSKGRMADSPEETTSREAREKEIEMEQRAKIKAEILKEREIENRLKKKQLQRCKRKQLKARARQELNAAEKKAKQQRAEELARQSADKPTEQTPDSKSAVGDAQQGAEPDPRQDAKQTQALAEIGKVGEAVGSPNPEPSDSSVYEVDSPSELSDDELELYVNARLSKHLAAVAVTDKVHPRCRMPASASEKKPDRFERDPWNAVVLGLRVYHQCNDSSTNAEPAIHLRVVRPDLNSETDKEAADGQGKENKEDSTELDVDDSAKDATLVGGETDRRKSIMGL